MHLISGQSKMPETHLKKRTAKDDLWDIFPQENNMNSATHQLKKANPKESEYITLKKGSLKIIQNKSYVQPRIHSQKWVWNVSGDVNGFKGRVSPKLKNPVFIYQPSCHSKPV